MTDNEIIKAWDILCKFDFFGGQRAGRELWNEKPTDIQDKDIEAFSHDVAFLKDFINRQKAEISRLTVLAELGNMRANDYRVMRDKCKTAKAEAIKEFAERLKAELRDTAKIDFQGGYYYLIGVPLVDNLVEEMVGDDDGM